MPFDINTWIIAPLIALLIPVFWWKIGRLLFKTGNCSREVNASLEAARYLVMLLAGFGNFAAAHLWASNRALRLGLSFGGGFCLLLANGEYWWYMNEGARLLLIGLTLAGMIALVTYYT